MTKLLIVAITYFIYNFYFFRYASAVMDISPIKTRNVWLTFLVNYSVFILCTIVQLHLIINWCIFFVFLLVEVRLFCHCSYLKDSTVALTGALVGLTVNLFFRNMIAIVMQAPLAAFDNNSDLPGNAKQYPIALGFLCAGLWFLVVTGGKHNIRMREIIKDNKSLKFFFILMVSMYGYLCLNLLVYYAPGDYLVLKVWALKANAVVVIGYYLSLSFSYSMSRLERYRSENKEARMKLEEGRKEEEKLQSIAYHDPLTGCELSGF